MTYGRGTAPTLSLVALLSGLTIGAVLARAMAPRFRITAATAATVAHLPRAVALRAALPLIERRRAGPRVHRDAAVASVPSFQRADPAAMRFTRAVDRNRVPEDTEPVVVELQLGRLVSRTVQGYRVRTEVLLPLTQFLQMAEVLFRLTPEGRLEATLDPGRVRIVVDAQRDTMVFGTRRVRVEPDFKVFRDGELYVGAERLGDLLGLNIIVDWSELTVTVVDASQLPIALRARREASRQAFLRRGDGIQAERLFGIERPRWDGLVFDYSVFAPTDDPMSGGAYTAALGADAFGGSLEIGIASVGALDRGTARLEGSWTGVWRDSRYLKQLRLGDGISTGPHVRVARGVSATNAPYIRPSLVGNLRYTGSLEPGWTIEAYRGGDLVAFDSTDAGGAFAVDLPVRYGENPVDFVAYGPFGEVRQINRTYRVLGELLPARRFEYGASAGECLGSGCMGTANLDLRYGVSRRWTVRGGFDQVWRDTLADLFQPYAAVTATPTNAWAIDLEGVGRGFARSGVRFEPSLNLRVEGAVTAFARGFTDPLLAPPGRLSQWSLAAFVRPSTTSGYVFLHGGVDRTTTVTASETRAQLGGSFQISDVRVLPFVRVERSDPASGGGGTTRSFAGVNTYFLPRPQFGRLLGKIWARTALETERVRGLTAASAFAGRNLGSAVRLEAGVTYQRGAPVTYLVSLVTYLSSARTVSVVTAPAGGPVTGTQFVQGSVLWDRTLRRVALAPGPSLERSGLAGRVFLDENGNGLVDPGEPGLPNVRVLVGTRRAVSDSAGVYRVWDIVPFEPILVAVDSLTLESPLLVPAFATTSIIPGPNRFRALDLPIVQAGVIEGRVARGHAGGRGIGGVTLVLTDRRSGAQRRIVTFTDGDFYLLGVKPGDYDLTVEDRVLEGLGMMAEPLRLTLTAGVHGVGASGLEVVLTPRP